MITVQCVCGARGQAPPELAGRTVRCKKCGGTIMIPGDGETFELADAAKFPPNAPPPLAFTPPELTAAGRHAEQVRARRRRSFWADLLASPTMLSFGGWNALRTVVAVGIALGAFLSCSYYLSHTASRRSPELYVALLCAGAFVGYGLLIISHTAGGEDALPAPTSLGEDFEEYVLRTPFEAWTATLIAAAPALANIGFQSWTRRRLALDFDLPLVALAGLGLAMWPAILLCVALNGLNIVLRPDLIVRTAAAAPVAYLAIIGMVAGALALLLAPSMGQGVLGSGGQLGAATLGAYLYLVVMRCIGLYYRHYSDHFPWSGG